MKEPLVTIIMPTLNNYEYVAPAVTSILHNTPHDLYELLIINNGDPHSCDFLKANKDIKVINTGKNIGWEGAIDLGMKSSKSPYVCFFNDDAYIPSSSKLWLNDLLQHFLDPQVGAVGPASNVVMGAQNIFYDISSTPFRSRFIIGFCALLRRSAFEEIGGMDMTLPGGDDLDWSIRLNEAGYSIIIDRGVFVFHHGFKTGTKVFGDSQKKNGWNSFEQWDKTNQALIKKHGLKVWWKTLSNQII